MTAVAVLIGFGLGTIPSAHLLALAAGHNLRVEGTGNPGTANALAVGGKKLAGAVLLMDIVKGILAVQIGSTLDPRGRDPTRSRPLRR